MNAGTVGAASVRIVFAILREVMPVSPEMPKPRELDRLREEYTPWSIVGLLLFFVFAPTFGWAWYVIFHNLAGRQIGPPVPGQLALGIAPFFWAIPAGVAGVLTASVPMSLVLRALLRERYAEYSRFERFQQEFDMRPVGWFLYGAGTLGVALLVGLGLRPRLVVDEVAITTRGAFGAEVVRPHAQIVDLGLIARFIAPNGRSIRQPYHAIRYQDGSIWTTRDTWQDLDAASALHVIAIAERRSRRPIRPVDTIEEFR